MQKVKVIGHSVKIETDGGDCITSRGNTVDNYPTSEQFSSCSKIQSHSVKFYATSFKNVSRQCTCLLHVFGTLEGHLRKRLKTHRALCCFILRVLYTLLV